MSGIIWNISKSHFSSCPLPRHLKIWDSLAILKGSLRDMQDFLLFLNGTLRIKGVPECFLGFLSVLQGSIGFFKWQPRVFYCKLQLNSIARVFSLVINMHCLSTYLEQKKKYVKSAPATNPPEIPTPKTVQLLNEFESSMLLV